MGNDNWVLNWNMERAGLDRMSPAAMRTWMAATRSLRIGDQHIDRPEALAVAAEASIATIRRGLRELETMGLVERDPRGGRVIPPDVAYAGRKNKAG